MTESAAKAFAEAVKKIKVEHDKIHDTYYKKFIVGKDKPTKDDIKRFTLFIKESEKMSEAWHDIALGAIRGFGGSSDTVIASDKVMLKTMLKKSAE